MKTLAQGWEQTEATVTEWVPEAEIDHAAANGPVRPPLTGRLPKEASH